VQLAAYEAQPENFTSLLAVPGVGAKGLRALALSVRRALHEAKVGRTEKVDALGAWPGWRPGRRAVVPRMTEPRIARLASLTREN
jgi:hypothetical protein